jgi:hypothetical protein
MPKLRFKPESRNGIAPYTAPPALSPALIAERRACENRTTDTGPLKAYWAAVHIAYPQIWAMTDEEISTLNQWIAALRDCVAVVTTERAEGHK